MNDDKVFRLLMETNPVPDPDGLDSPLALNELERRSPTMAANQPSSGNRSNRLLIGAVAAVAVLVVGLGTWAAFANDEGPGPTTTAAVAASSTSSPSTTGAPATTTSTSPAQAAAVATVTEYYATTNRGDVDGVMDMLTGPFAMKVGDGAYQRILAAANLRIDITEPCRVLDVAVDHQELPMDPANPETAVECGVRSYNDYHGPGGIFHGGDFPFRPRMDQVYVTADGKLIALYDDVDDMFLDEVFFGYNRAFYNWLEVAHPDVHEQIKVADGESIPGWPDNPEHMAIAIEYVEEFVAQSDVYPLEPNDG